MKGFFRDRYSILSFTIIIMIIIISYRLFQLQIVNGMYYKNEAEKKLIRVNNLKAPRGVILDKNNKVLANNRPGFTIEITKSKIDDKTINNSLSEIIKIIEKNGDTYKDNLPIILPNEFAFPNDTAKISWEHKYKIPINSSAHEAFLLLRDKYNISPQLSDEAAREIMALRYEMSEQGYNSFKSVVLAFDVSQKTVSEVEERNLEFPGVNVSVKPIRNYPNGTVASHVLGYIGNINQNELHKLKDLNYQFNDIIGKSGIEKTAEIYLKGKDGKKFIETDLSGRFSQSLENIMPKQGGKITLTIDLDIQKAAETALEETIKKIKTGGFYKKFSDVEGGAAVAVDVNTGEILALASYPNFDPGTFSKGITTQDWKNISNDPLKPLINRAISGRYAPGSTFKMITGISALEENVISIDETVLDKGKYTYYRGYQPACWLYRLNGGSHGYVNITDALKFSCNYFFYDVGRRLGINRMSEYASEFGLDKKTGVELDGEIAGIVASQEAKKKISNQVWYPGDTLQAAIGQSVSAVTPIAMASYISTLANGGTQYQLHLIKSERSYDESEIYTEKSARIINKLDINDKNLRAVLEGMRKVINDPGGTAYGSFIDFPKEITVAGKTGTSQTGIGKGSPNGWFVGFAPYDKPQIAVAVLIEHGGSGGYSAPVAKAIFSEYFDLNKQPVKEIESNNNLDQQDVTDLEVINQANNELNNNTGSEVENKNTNNAEDTTNAEVSNMVNGIENTTNDEASNKVNNVGNTETNASDGINTGEESVILE